MHFSNNLRLLRTQRGLKQSELGKIIGVKQAQISKYEQGASTPDFETLNKIVEYFKVSYDDLLVKDLNSQEAEVQVVMEEKTEYLPHVISRLEKELQRMEGQIAKMENKEVIEKLYELRDELIRDNPQRAKDLGFI